jgi:hypothetical protein
MGRRKQNLGILPGQEDDMPDAGTRRYIGSERGLRAGLQRNLDVEEKTVGGT